MVKEIVNLDIGHVRRSFDNNFKIKISDVFDDNTLETDFPHRHNFYMICLVTHGSGEHIIDFEKIEIRPNRLFFLKPEQVHFWNVKPRSKLAIIQFSADYLSRLFSLESIPAINLTTGSYFDLTTEDVHSFNYLFQQIDKESLKSELNSEKIIQSIIFILLAYIDRLLAVERVDTLLSNKSEVLIHFKKLLSAKYKEVTTIKEYAKLLNISPNYLNIIVKEITGHTAIDLLHSRIVLEAKRLLINKNMDIAQIGFELGFKDASYFARFFKKSTGISPTHFRNDIYKKYQQTNN